MDLSAKARSTLERVLAIDGSSDGWKKVKETSDCTVYSRPSEDYKGYIYKAEGVINADPEKVFSFAYPGVEKPRRMEWDNSLADSGVVAKLSPDTDVILSHTKPACMGLVSSREFVDLVKVVREENRIFTAAVSIDHESAPKSRSHVRGFNYPNSLFCYRIPGNPNETRFVQYVQSDLGGMLPQSLVDSAIPSTIADTYPQIKAAIAKG